MTHVVTEHCAGCRFTSCVTVCPVNCFHGDDARLYIDPDLCIDCGVCIPQCPVKAISEEIELADADRRWLAINAEKASQLPVIREKQSPLEGAEARRAALGFGAWKNRSSATDASGGDPFRTVECDEKQPAITHQHEEVRA